MKRVKFFWLLLLSGCMVGPRYTPPDVVLPDSFQEENVCENLYVADDDLIGWWERFNDDFLNWLLEETLTSNLDLRFADELICQARAEFGVAAANLLPTISFDAIAARSKATPNLFVPGARPAVASSPYQNFFLIGFDAAWELDFFGRLERSKRAAFFNWQAFVENARAVQITVLSEVALDYVTICALQNRSFIASEIVLFDQERLALIEDRFQAGLASLIEVEEVKEILRLDMAALNQLEIILKQAIYSLGTLLGRPPEMVTAYFEEIRPIPDTSGEIPISIPSDLLRRRPDIRQAEREIAKTVEEIGVAVADLFPNVSLISTNLFEARARSANIGFGSTSLKNIFSKPGLTWSWGLSLFQPLLDFGKRIEAVKARKCISSQAITTYEKTVIEALEEVEDALVAYFKEEERSQNLMENTRAAEARYLMTTDLFQAGLVDYSQVLITKRDLNIARDLILDSQRQLAVNLIALYKALGGEWVC